MSSTEPFTNIAALLFGVAIDDVTMDEALDAVGELVVSGRRQRRTHQIATANVDFLVNTIGDQSARRLLQNADLCLADGMPVVWAAKASGVPLRERLAGADLVPAIAQRSASTGWKVHFFGSTAGTAERSVEILTQRFPGAQITGDSGPIISDIERVDESILDDLASRDPDIVCVALGNPKQERFIDIYRERLRIPVMIGIGGSLDMLVGDKQRAPQWVQRIGMEWTIRAMQEPGRLGRRYAHDARVFFPALSRYLRTVRSFNDGSTLANVATFDDARRQLDAAGHLSLDLGSIETMTLPALAELVAIARWARRTGSSLDVGTISSGLTAELDALELGEYLG